MRRQIIAQLKAFEKEKGVEILLAVESGSRAWGFASKDADYDVRFVYKHPMKDYLQLNKPAECYNWMDGELDYEGFDIYKFFDLLLKSNMNIIDWLMQEELIYIDKLPRKVVLKQAMHRYFDRNTYISHNYGLADKNYRKYFGIASSIKGEPTAKRYVYCIRALLSADYCARTGTIAPYNMEELIALSELTGKQQKSLLEVIEAKKKGKEKDSYVNETWHTYIRKKLQAKPEVPKSNVHDYQQLLSVLNDCIQQIVMSQ